MAARPTAGSRTTWLGLLAALLVVGLVWWQQGGDPDAPERSAAAPAATSTPSPSDTVRPSGESDESGESDDIDDSSGLPVVELDLLPAEARDTLARIDAGGPYPYQQDDETFFNRERLLPDRPEGYYREYTVETPGSDDRGARRLVVGGGGEVYWTDDHYASFSRVAR